MSELLNSLRLMFSRLASHRCPNGHYLEPTLDVAAEQPIYCPVCGARVMAPGAEQLAFNSEGACRRCGGTGIVRTVDESKLVPDESLTIDQGAVAPWGSLMWSLMKDIAREMGVRTDVPFKDLTPEEKEIVEKAAAGIAKFDKEGGSVDTSVGFRNAGYADLNGKTVPIPKIVNAINSGTSFMNKQPFVRKAAKAATPKVLAAMQERIDAEIDAIGKEVK
jgi:hypothetical protein